jgi:hypothetical protein
VASDNTLLTPTIIAKEALMHLVNNLVMGANVHRRYKNEFKKVGGTITIRKPVKFRATKARTRVNSDITEPSTTLQVATQAHVSWGFFSKDLTLTIEEYAKRYIKPAAIALANAVDEDLCALYDDVYNSTYETAYVTPSTFLTLGKAGQMLDEEACPQDDRTLVVNPAAHWALANGLKGVYNSGIEADLHRKGFLGRVANFSILMDQNIKAHTVGSAWPTSTTGLPAVATTGSTGASLLTYKWGASAGATVLKVGDVFTIANVYAVNPVSGASTGSLRKFTVTADLTNNSGTETAGELTVSISPAIVTTGPYQTCDSNPLTDAVLTLIGTVGRQFPQNLGFHENAFALVCVPLVLPKGVWGSRMTYKNVSIRILKDYDIDDDEEICRMDILYGVKTLYPELATRIYGKVV